MDRVFNYSAGPSCLPIEVLEEVKRDLLNYKNKGFSVLEMNHRTEDYYEINDEANSLMKELLKVGDDYQVLFLQGGGYTQFSTFPINLAESDDLTLYVKTGNFSTKAYNEGKKFTNAKVIATSEDKNFSYIPKITKDMVDQNAKYLHICVNNTAFGTCYNTLPDTGDVPLIGDMSSIILAKNYDIKKFGMIYGGVQKNLGAAGATFVVIKNDLIKENDKIASMSSYKILADGKSIFNTPPVFSVYIVGLMLKWVKKQGGVESLDKIAKEKSKIIYDLIDNSKFYKGTANVYDRSPMNVTFLTPSEDLDIKFVKEAKENGMINLKGHKAAGGLRASLYNAMPLEGVNKLKEFMNKFERDNKV